MPPNTRQRQCRIHETVAFTWQPVFPKNSWWPKDTKQLKFWCIMRHLEYKQVTQVTESEQTCIILIFQMSANCSHLQPLARSATCSHLQPLAATCPVSHLQPLAATCSHLAATWQKPCSSGCSKWLPSGCKWLQVAASGCQVAAKWPPSDCRVPSWKKSDFVDSTFFQVCSKWLPNGWHMAAWASGCQVADGASGCQVAASGCKWLQVAAKCYLEKKVNL